MTSIRSPRAGSLRLLAYRKNKVDREKANSLVGTTALICETTPLRLQQQNLIHLSCFLSERTPSSDLWYLDVAVVHHSLCLCHRHPEQNVRQNLSPPAYSLYFININNYFLLLLLFLQAVSHHLVDVRAGLGSLLV